MTDKKNTVKCPYCGSTNIHVERKVLSNNLKATCFDCSGTFDPRYANVPWKDKIYAFIGAVILFPGSIIFNICWGVPYWCSVVASLACLILPEIKKPKDAA